LKKSGQSLLRGVQFSETRPSFFIFCLFTFFLLPSCYEKKESCLDIRASNFDLEGDIPCEDCCEYPLLELKFLHRNVLADTILTIGYSDSTYFDGADNPFRIKNIKYYISNMRLVATDGTEAQVNEEIEINTPQNGLVTFKDDFLLVNGSLSSFLTAGSFSEIKTYNKIRFSLGLDNSLESVDPATLPDNHVLTVNQDSSMFDYQNGYYLLANIEIFKDTTAIDTIPRLLEIGAFVGPEEIELSFPEDIILPEGFNFQITLQIDAPSWFESSNVRIDGDEQLYTEIVSKMSQSFSVLEVKADND
jgi:hypothetical protein